METIEEKKLLLDANTCRLIREYVPQRDTLMALSDFFATLSDSTRIKILSALSISPMCVNDISVMLGINQTTVSHQLKNLRSIGAVDYRRQGKIRFYHRWKSERYSGSLCFNKGIAVIHSRIWPDSLTRHPDDACFLCDKSLSSPDGGNPPPLSNADF